VFFNFGLNPTDYGADLSRTVSWQVNDGTLTSNTVTSTVKVVGVDQAPVLSSAGNTVSYTQGKAAVIASATINAADVDSSNLASASVSISSGFFTGDVLGATASNGITASYNASTGVLTLTGSATLADYRKVLHSVTFHSTSGNPTHSGTDFSRTLSWQVNDGTLASNTVTSTVTVVGVGQPPVISGAGNTVSYTQGGAAVIASPTISATDIDSPNLASASVSISTGFIAGDVLGATASNGITVSYNAGTGVLTLSGSATPADYRKVLHTVTFHSTSANPTNFGADTSRTLSWQVNDGTLNSNTVTSTVTVVGVDQAPVLSGGGNTVRFTQGSAALIASPAISATDVDNLNLASASVSISTGFFAGDTLAATTTGTGITASYNASTGVLTLSGSATLANYRKVLDSVTFRSASANPTDYGADLSRTMSWQVNDGTLASNTVTSTVTVVGVDQAPVLSGAEVK